MHFVFHVNFFKPAATNKPHLGYIQPLEPPITVDGKIEYKVTAIVDFCIFEKIKKLQYRVQWTCYAKLNWKNALNITIVTDQLHDFHTRYPNKLGLLPWIRELAELANKEG